MDSDRSARSDGSDSSDSYDDLIDLEPLPERVRQTTHCENLSGKEESQDIESLLMIYCESDTRISFELEEHLHTLDKVLSKLADSGLRLKKAKCVFMVPSVDYLGHRIDREGLHPTDATYYEISKPLRLACDASPYGIGAVLSHEMEDGSERRVGYVSRILSPAEKGPFMGHMFWVMSIDAHSNGSRLHEVDSCSTYCGTFKSTFAIHGIPRKIVTDNGPSFAHHQLSYCWVVALVLDLIFCILTLQVEWSLDEQHRSMIMMLVLSVNATLWEVTYYMYMFVIFIAPTSGFPGRLSVLPGHSPILLRLKVE
eukprot:Em0012g630a